LTDKESHEVTAWDGSCMLWAYSLYIFALVLLRTNLFSFKWRFQLHLTPWLNVRPSW